MSPNFTALAEAEINRHSRHSLIPESVTNEYRIKGAARD